MENLSIKAEFNNNNKDDKKTPKISGVVYAGGKIDVGFEYPVIVDLNGLELTQETPLLTDHENKTSARIGVITAKIENNILTVEGQILSESNEAKDIIAQAKNSTWQASIGADIVEAAKVETGKMVVNGIEQEAPFIFVSKSILREVSIVAVGADKDTQLKIEAKKNLKIKTGVLNTMENEIKVEKIDVNAEVKAALDLERKRIADIKSIVNNECTELENEAISAGWTADVVASKMLEKIRSNRPVVNVITKTEIDNTKVIEAALSLRAGISEDKLVKALGEQVVEAGSKERNISLKDAMEMSLKASGKSFSRYNVNDMIQASFATSLPGILSNVANKRLANSFNTYEPVAFKIASVADIKDFKQSEIYNLSDVGNLTEVGADSTLADSELTETKGVNQLSTYGKVVNLTRKDIVNDDLGAFLRVFDVLGNRCAKTIDQLTFKKLLANGNYSDSKALFHADHKNLGVGVDTALSFESVKTAISNFMRQVGADGEPIGAMPRYLVVPSELYFLAKEICESQYVVAVSGKITGQLNPVANMLEVVSSPYLSNSAYTGYSASAWYLAADPTDVAGLEIGFLNGNRTPFIEQGTPDFNQLGISFRCYYDLGVGIADYRGLYKNTGVAAE